MVICGWTRPESLMRNGEMMVSTGTSHLNLKSDTDQGGIRVVLMRLVN